MDISSVVVFVGLVLLAAIAGAVGTTWLIGPASNPGAQPSGTQRTRYCEPSAIMSPEQRVV